MSLKTENSRRVAKSRPVCMGLKIRATNFASGKPALDSLMHHPIENLYHHLQMKIDPPLSITKFNKTYFTFGKISSIFERF